MAERDPYVAVHTTVYRDDYEWAAHMGVRHGVSVDAIMRASLAYLRALIIAEITSIASIKSEYGIERHIPPTGEGAQEEEAKG